MSKKRISTSIDNDLILAAQEAVAGGRAESVSAWFNEALRRQVEHDRRLSALAEFVGLFEAEHGEITDEEIAQATRRARARAVVVRGSKPQAKGPAKRKGVA